MKHKTTMLDNRELLQVTESLLISWAYEIGHGNLTNKSRYEYLLGEFSAADLMNDKLGTIRTMVYTYLKEVHNVQS